MTAIKDMYWVKDRRVQHVLVVYGDLLNYLGIFIFINYVPIVFNILTIMYYSCLPGQHPRLRWNRRRRSVEMRFIRSKYIQAHYRWLQRHLAELVNDDHSLERAKRSVNHQREKRSYHLFDHSASSRLFGVHKRQRYLTVRRNNHNNAVDNDSHRRVSRTLSDVIYRQMRQPFQGDEAYAKYLAKIKQRYQKYVKNILGHNNVRNSFDNSNDTFNDVLNSQFKEKTVARNDLAESNKYYAQQSQMLNYRPVKKQQQQRAKSHQGPFLNSTHGPPVYSQNDYQIINNNYLHIGVMPEHDQFQKGKPNISEIMAKLNAQIVRRKRSASNVNLSMATTSETKRKRNTPDDDVRDLLSSNNNQRTIGRKGGRRNLNVTGSSSVSETGATDTDGIDMDAFKRGKPKSPCEVSCD